MRPECRDCKLTPEEMLKCEVVDLLTERQTNAKNLRCNRGRKWIKEVKNPYARADGQVRNSKPKKNGE